MFSETSGADRTDQNCASVTGHNGMVCASQPLASQAGLDILTAGGNAVEAAIAANAVLSVVEPMSCGPGGDLFAIVWIEKEQRLFGLNASGRSPFYWNIPTAESMGFDEIPLFGPLSWSVPGCVSGWEMLLKRFGSLSFGRLLEAAAAHARDGFEVTPIIARGWARTDFKTYPTLAETFAPNGQAPKPGDLFRNLGMAHL
jgi:gamma-glutamyltranspeptidase/glutathione hydrolase